MKIIIFIILLNILVFSTELCINDEQLDKISKKYMIDFRVKSTDGWLRVFHNKKKYNTRGYIIQDNDRLYIIYCLEKKSLNK